MNRRRTRLRLDWHTGQTGVLDLVITSGPAGRNSAFVLVNTARLALLPVCGTVPTKAIAVGYAGRMKFVGLTPLRQRPARAAVAVAYFAAIAAVVGWSSPKGIAAGDQFQLAVPVPDSGAGRPRAPATRAPKAHEASKPRGKVTCAECGVIESMQRIDTRLEFTGWCDAAEIARSQNGGSAFGRGFRGDRESLSETVAVASAANRGSTKDVVTSRHRIVVRMHNGKRQVFDEAAPRMVNVGDRIVVIAGAHPANG